MLRRAAIKCFQRGGVAGAARQGTRKLCYSTQVPARQLKRNRGAGRPVFAPEICEELRAWFVDRLWNNPSRITTTMIILQARLLHDYYVESLQLRAENGEIDPEVVARAGKYQFNEAFVKRWRQAFGVTWRTVNLRFKLSLKIKKPAD